MFEVIERDHALRRPVELAIRSVYLHGYGATLGTLPRMLVADIRDGSVRSAAALRYAADGFLSECYLDAPIEQVVAAATDRPCRRETIAEVGSLAARSRGAAGPLIVSIIAHLHRSGSAWAFFTATAGLRAMLARAGLPMIDLAPADPARIAHAWTWGSYYEHDPRVLLVGAGMLAPAARTRIRPARVHEHA